MIPAVESDDSGSGYFCCCWRPSPSPCREHRFSQAAETGGTGISTGAVSGYGSVVVNNVHFRTDDEVAPGFHTKKMSNGADKSGRMDQCRLRSGDGS